MLKVKRLIAVLAVLLMGCFAAACAETVLDVMVDFELLTTLNEDCVGWLYQPQSGINQPVMRHETDKWYQERAFDETKVYKVGSVYQYADETLEDQVIVLRGQVRQEGCLAPLTEWCEQEVFDQRKDFVLLTPEGNYQAQAFACLRVEERYLSKWLPQEQNFDEWLTLICENSLVTVEESMLPAEDDRMLFVAGLHLNGSVTLVMTKLVPAVENAEPSINLIKLALDETETLNGIVNAGPAGWLMYYAQNDPLYADMRYESAKRSGVYRDFGGGGCGPTAMAIIVANLVEKDQLPLLGAYAKSELGTLFCACSVNRVYCNHLHVPYQMQTPEEYLRYLPVAMGDFAAGNNSWEFLARRINSQGTHVRFVEYACEVYGLNIVPVNGLTNALEYMKEKTGKGLILLSALRGSPLTNSSHFVVLTGVDEEYFYILDPFRRTREEYRKTDIRNILECVSPGVVRIRLSDAGRSDLSPVYYISAENEN